MGPVDFKALRQEYMIAGLHERDLAADPIEQFSAWFDDAIKAGILGPEAMTLATVAEDGTPAARIVLLKDFSAEGFTFFTNLHSAKAEELQANPRAALLFFWRELERQVRVTGHVEPVARAIAEKYFYTRPRGSQLGAWASPQSEVIASREPIEVKYDEYQRRFHEAEVPLPGFWGGFRIVPETLEFWQGRENRLHDRLRYRLDEGRNWIVERLAP
jgi:pyridoxamine 5'-phosphate oxidase